MSDQETLALLSWQAGEDAQTILRLTTELAAAQRRIKALEDATEWEPVEGTKGARYMAVMRLSDAWQQLPDDYQVFRRRPQVQP